MSSKLNLTRFCGALFFALFCTHLASAQRLSLSEIQPQPYPPTAGSLVKTYVNPVLGGDHPDPTLLKVGDDFYMCGSSFHFVPNLPVLHSTDLLHWEMISRVVPVDWTELKSGAPGAGIWQGAITYFYGSFHIYFSNGSGGGQFMSSALNPGGPWSRPVKVKTTDETGPTGYDNSIFVDDDGTPYMIIKTGQVTNRIQQIDHDGNLTGNLINLDWINHHKKYSWAEGPVMCKRNGWYYYFMAGDVTGGQYVLRSKALVSDSTQWESLGTVFAFSKDPENRFRSANHMSSPFQLKDGTWWCIAQSYDAPKGDDWSGQGRQDLLLQIQWTSDGRPFVPYPSDQPLTRPDLLNKGLSWRLPRSDAFSTNQLSFYWHFLNKNAAMAYSLKEHEGWLRLKPQAGRTHILQKEGGRSYALVTRMAFNATDSKDQAGLYITSGNESVNVRLYSGFEANKKKIYFTMGKQSHSLENTIGELIWLKMERNNHQLTGFCSGDGLKWTAVGIIDATDLDKVQPNYNAWVGTSIGLFTEGKPADFDLFLYKDALTQLPLAGANNYLGVTLSQNGAMLNQEKSGWAMLGGVDFALVSKKSSKIKIIAAATNGGYVEIWIDDLMNGGKRIANIAVKKTGGLTDWKTISLPVSAIGGQHDLYIKIVGTARTIAVKSIAFE